jgi:hypothetical protein
LTEYTFGHFSGKWSNKMAIKDTAAASGSAYSAPAQDGSTAAPKGDIYQQRAGTYMSAGGNSILTSLAGSVRTLINSDTANPKLDVSTLSSSSLHCGSLLISEIRESPTHGKIAVVYTILVESTEQNPLATTDYTWNNKRFEVPLVLTDAFNTNYWEAVKAHIAARLNVRVDSSVICAGVGFITREVYDRFGKGGEGNDEYIIGTVVSAAEAIGTIGDSVSGVVKRQSELLSEIAKGSESRIQRFIGTHPLFSNNGLPLACEARLVIDTVPTNRDRRNVDVINNGGSQLVTTYGFLETIVDMAESQRNFGRRFSRQQDEEPCIANFVITAIRNPAGRMDIQTIGEGIFAAMGILIGNGWAEMLTPKYGADNSRDIGMLMVEVGHMVDNNNDPLDTQSPDFDERQRNDYIGAMYRPEISISIDFPEAGDMSWAGDIMVNASSSVKNPHRAVVNRALHQFTDGNFPIDYAGDILIDTSRRILIGYDQDAAGNLMDPRLKNDYLSLLTAQGRNDLEMVRDWDIHTRPEDMNGVPEQVRLAVTHEIPRRVFGNSARYVTAVRRYVISTDFIETFGAACNAAGLTPRPANATSINTAGSRRGADIYSSQSMGRGSASLFRQNNGGGHGGGGYMRGRGITGSF